MNIFGKNKKSKKTSDTRGLCDSHLSQPYHVTFPPTSSSSLLPVSAPAPAPSHITSPPVSSVATLASPPIKVPYEPPHQARYDGPSEMKVDAGGNENGGGEQEVDDVEIGNSSNGVVSPIFASNGAKFDIKIGNNKNNGPKQKIGKVKFGNAN